MKIRYIRDWQNGRTINGAQGTNCDWRQIMAIDYFGRNRAKGKANGVELPGNFWVGQGAFWSFITDENFNTNLWTSDRPNERKSVTIDLGDIYDIDKLVIARANNPAICKETKTEVSTDNIVWYTVFDSSIEGTYVEQQNGREFKLQDDRFNVPNEDSSLGEIISFFDDYSEFNKVQKNVLKNNLINKGVEVTDSDKMSSLIGKVDDIKSPKTYKPGSSIYLYKNTFTFQGGSYKIDYHNTNFTRCFHHVLNFNGGFTYYLSYNSTNVSYSSVKLEIADENDVIISTYESSPSQSSSIRKDFTDIKNGYKLIVSVRKTNTNGGYFRLGAEYISVSEV